MNKVDILAIGVHPDDIELCCSGTLIKHIKEGYKVGLCDLTRGELGTRGTPELRIQEAERSRVLMGADFRVNLGLPDGFISHDESSIRSIIKVIRNARPSIVLANAIEDRHPDHGRASKIISDACFYSGLRKIEVDNLDAWRPDAVYHYIQDRWVAPDFVIDVSDFMAEKFECIMAFSSQFYDPKSEEPPTPISGEDFMEHIKSINRMMGRIIGADYGEGYTVERAPGVEDLFHLR